MPPKSSMYYSTVEQDLGCIRNDLERLESSLGVVPIIMCQSVYPSLQFLDMSAKHCHVMARTKRTNLLDRHWAGTAGSRPVEMSEGRFGMRLAWSSTYSYSTYTMFDKQSVTVM